MGDVLSFFLVALSSVFEFFFFIALLFAFLRRRFNLLTTNETADPATIADRSRHLAVIETFPILFYSAVKDLKIGKAAALIEECPVCLSEFEDNETVRLLPKCNHVFHPHCIDAWLVSHMTCPVCRAKLTTEPGELAAHSAAQSTELNGESVQENSVPGFGEEQTQNHVVIDLC